MFQMLFINDGLHQEKEHIMQQQTNRQMVW